LNPKPLIQCKNILPQVLFKYEVSGNILHSFIERERDRERSLASKAFVQSRYPPYHSRAMIRNGFGFKKLLLCEFLLSFPVPFKVI